MKAKGILLIGFSIFICACIRTYDFKEPYTQKKFFTSEPYPEIQNLTRIEHGRVITIPQRLIWVMNIKEKNFYAEQGLLPGRYIEASQNELGTFYFGEERPYYLCLNKQPNCNLYAGGFWLPASKDKLPRLFFSVQGGEVFVVPDIDAEAKKLQDKSNLKEPYAPLMTLMLKMNDPSFILVRSPDHEADVRFSNQLSELTSKEQ